MAITTKHLDQMRHAVGFFSERPGYRNRFCTESDDPIWVELVDLGFAGSSNGFGAFTFWLTESGTALIGLDQQVKFKNDIDKDHVVNIRKLCELHEIDC